MPLSPKLHLFKFWKGGGIWFTYLNENKHTLEPRDVTLLWNTEFSFE